MGKYHGFSLVFDVFYLLDLIGDCRYYAFYDHHGFLVNKHTLIWHWMKKQKLRMVVKIFLILPLYLFSDALYCLKLLSVIHIKTIHKFTEKLAIYVG